VEAALAVASYRAASPEAFAAEVVRALAQGIAADDVSPAADALLRALFGRMLQAMTLGRGSQAVFAAPSTAGAIAPALAPAPAPAPLRAPPPPVAASSRAGSESQSVVPREARPHVQALGP
jgi:hypothetical protein